MTRHNGEQLWYGLCSRIGWRLKADEELVLERCITTNEDRQQAATLNSGPGSQFAMRTVRGLANEPKHAHILVPSLH